MRLKISARFWRQVFQKNPPEREREREENKERKRRNWREREERNTGWEVELFPPHFASGYREKSSFGGFRRGTIFLMNRRSKRKGRFDKKLSHFCFQSSITTAKEVFETELSQHWF
jgi:hypothetical protein